MVSGMNIIAAVTSNWGIGKDNSLLLSIPDDMRFFREKTRGAAVIMGRKTLESFPGGNPLKGRVNIVLTNNRSFKKDGAVCVFSAGDAIAHAKKTGRPVFVIGGESIYRLFLPYCEKAYITKMQTLLPADSFFPNLDGDPDWSVFETGDEMEYEGVKYSFVTYINNNVKE